MAQKDVLDIIYQISMIVIAVANIGWVIYVFYVNLKRDVDKENKARKIDLLKTLVLDYNMRLFYEFYKNVLLKCAELKQDKLSVSDKRRINDEILAFEREFEAAFIDLFLAIDDKLYVQLKRTVDTLIDQLTQSIFNEGINLYVDHMNKEQIQKHIHDSKCSMLSTLFSYSG